MSFGVAPLGTAALGSTGGVAGVELTYYPASLGCIVTLGSPSAIFDTTHDVDSLGCVATFGAATGAGSVFRARSLGVVTMFGRPRTIGSSSGAAESLGYVARFGSCSAIRFKRRPAA